MSTGGEIRPRCAWCRSAIAERRVDARFCGKRCRQAAWRLRAHLSPGARGDASAGPERPLRLAYADPPYPGLSRKYYGDHPDYRGEVDHPALVKRLSSTYDGWALSTSAKALRDVLPLCPPEARVCAWVKPGGAPPATYGLHNVWEPVIVFQARRLQPGKRDALYMHPARLGGSDLIGRKPIQFCAWLFEALGAAAGDTFDDLFPGSGIVGAAWREFVVAAGSRDASAAAAGDGSSRSRGDASSLEGRHVAEVLSDGRAAS
jgi:hypothetical protein